MTFWTPDEDAKLLQLKAQRVPHKDIAEAMGRSIKACSIRVTKLNEFARDRAAGIEPRQPRGFTDDEVAELLRMREVERLSFPEIDAALGRRHGVCKAKYRQVREGDSAIVERRLLEPPPIKVPPDRIADRDHRRALSPASITAALFGDPLPGRSALDLRGRL